MTMTGARSLTTALFASAALSGALVAGAAAVHSAKGEVPTRTVLPAGGEGDVSACPGTEIDKIDNLNSPTFTMPDDYGDGPFCVSVKAGENEYVYEGVMPGDVLNVKTDTGHDASHVHIHAVVTNETTTTEEETHTTEEETTTTEEETTTTDDESTTTQPTTDETTTTEAGTTSQTTTATTLAGALPATR